MKTQLQKLFGIIPQKYVHEVHGLMHLSYFTFVFIEGHSVYAVIAGGLAIITIVNHAVDAAHVSSP